MKKIPGLREMRLYYPNTWRKYIGDLASNEDKQFNWFLCSQRYRDPDSGLFIAEICPSVKFYDEKTGDTLVVPKDQNVKILILDDPKNTSLHGAEILDIIKKYKYQGVAHLQKCNFERPEQLVVCREAVFGFFDGVLKIPKDNTGIIIDYAKKNNACLRSHIPDFPSPQEIDESLKKYPHQTVCRALHQDIVRYTEKEY